MKVKTGVGRKTDQGVLQLVNSIIAGATGKAELAHSSPTAAELQTFADNGAQAVDDEALAASDLAMKRTLRAQKMAVLRDGINRFA